MGIMKTGGWGECACRYATDMSITCYNLIIASSLFLLVLPAVTAIAQPLEPSFFPVAPDVLSNSFVRCFYKDSRGYVWIGTEEALIRYDGSHAYRYVFDPADKTSLPHNTVNSIIEDKSQQLWIGTGQGLCIYNQELDNFINVDSIQGNRNFLNNRYITDLEFDSKGNLWIGTHEGGVNVYDPVRREFTYLADSTRQGILPSTNFINTLVNIDDVIWCSTKGGLLLFDAPSRKKLSSGLLARFSNAQVSAIAAEKSGSILIATVKGELTRVIPLNGRFDFQPVLKGTELGESSNRILTLSIDEKGNILVGGENSGFNWIEPRTNRVYRILAEEGNIKRLPTNSVQSIFVDDTGLIWIGTFNNGVYQLDNRKKKFKNHVITSGNHSFFNTEVRSFAEDKTGDVWIGYYGFGLAKIVAGTKSVQRTDQINSKLTNKNVTSLIYDRRGMLWVGTEGKGVFRVNPMTSEVTNYSLQSDGFGNDQVFCLYESKNGTIWAGTWGSGLFFFDEDQNEFVNTTDYDQPNHIPNTAYITDMLEDAAGTFWVGTLYGLYELSKQSENSFAYRLHLPTSDREKIMGTQIQAMVEDQNNDLWVGTIEALNVKRKGEKEFQIYPLNDGTRPMALRSILIDHAGNAWIGGNNGLSKFDATRKTFINYTRDDGLHSNSFQRRASLASSTGLFFFGTNRGFDSFFPDSIHATSRNAVVVLTDLKINNQSVRPGAPDSPLQKHISLTSDLELSYDQRSFVIDFVALDYGQSPGYRYCYKLEGFDKDWVCTGSEHSATYTNIDPGQYTFYVKVANRDGVWIDNQVNLTITIHQVFWKTWWAYSIYSVLLTALVYFLIKIREDRLQLKNEINFEKLTREQEHRLSESKTQFFTNVAHEFRTPLSLILIPLESLMSTHDVPGLLRKRILTAYKNATRMTRLVNELLDFNKMEVGNLKLHVQQGEWVHFIRDTASAFNEMAMRQGIKFSIEAATMDVMGWADRDKLERILFNVLSNAFKYTANGGEIKLKINLVEKNVADVVSCQCLELVIEDNGIGILPHELPHIFEKFYQAKSSSKITSPGTGIGLSYTKALVELHNGSIRAESIPDQSTIFTIILPIDGRMYQAEEKGIPTAPVTFELDADADIHGSEPGAEKVAGDGAHDRPNVLVVEDNEELRAYLMAELRSEFNVVEASNGAQGLTIAVDDNPDLIISDVMMPEMNGIELCHAIKSSLSTSHIPFILLTAKATVEDQIKGINTGADLYIPKPFNIRYLVACAHQIVDSRRKLYAKFSQDVYLMPGNTTTNDLDKEFLQKAVDYIVNNLQDSQLSVDSIAALYNLSRMQVYRKIKALTGKSVVEFIKMVRMKQAISLMDANKLTLAEIAYEVGFNSASYFTRCFKEEYGKTPSEYLERR